MVKLVRGKLSICSHSVMSSSYTNLKLQARKKLTKVMHSKIVSDYMIL